MGRSSQTSQSSTRQRRLPGKVISAMSPIGKIALMVVMMAIVEQSTSTISFARLGAQKDNLISAVGGIKRELLSPVAGIARGIFDAKNPSSVQSLESSQTSPRLSWELPRTSSEQRPTLRGASWDPWLGSPGPSCRLSGGFWTPRSTSLVVSEEEKTATQRNLIVVVDLLKQNNQMLEK